MLSDSLLRASGYFLKKAYTATKFTIYAGGVFIAASFAFIASPILICCCGNLVKGDLFGKGDGVGFFLGCVILGLVVPVVAIPVLPFVAVGSLVLGIGTGVFGIFSKIIEKICCCGRDAREGRDWLRERAEREAREEAREATARIARQQEAQRAAEAKEEARRAARAQQRAAQMREWEEQLQGYQRDEAKQLQRADQDQQWYGRFAPSAPVLPPPPSAPPAPGLFQRAAQGVVQEIKSEIFQPAPVERKAIPVLKAPLTDADIALMKSKLTEENRALFDAALIDKLIMEDEMRMPVLIADGRAYDQDTIKRLPEDKDGLKETPQREAKFKNEDIVPYNTLGEALRFVLNDIRAEENKQGITEQQIYLYVNPTLKKAAKTQKIENEAPCLSDEDLRLLKVYYDQLTPRRKQLFNIMCRDPLTGRILQDPVFLPDGYVYDRRTIQAYCAQKEFDGLKNWPCPKNTEVKFTKEQILKCFSARNVLDVLKLKVPQIKQQIEAAQTHRLTA